jgi:hypothetical protein
MNDGVFIPSLEATVTALGFSSENRKFQNKEFTRKQEYYEYSFKNKLGWFLNFHNCQKTFI